MKPFVSERLKNAGVSPSSIGVLQGKYPVTFAHTNFPPGGVERSPVEYFDIYCPTRPANIYEVSGTIQRKYFDYRTGFISFNPPMSTWTARWDTRVEGFGLYIQPPILEKAAFDLFGETPDELSWRLVLGDYAPSIAFLALDIGSQALNKYPAGVEIVEQQMTTLLNLLVRRFSSSPKRDTSLVGIHSSQVLRAVQYISDNLDNKISVQSIADAAASSPPHLNRLFRAELGTSVWKYVQKMRRTA
ncbi:helix-turn-helix domain-containing protein [Hirschia maritima]|uniref:AraC family transcriptional regulator n=1 Tax=Hirschia maritima TaxID=1121961 RepID=UPI00036FB180|nr:AraC family transcriptional regulator [Hirschia maritima]